MKLGQEFSALYQGQRLRFHISEHANLGDAWMCLILPGQTIAPRIVPSNELSEIDNLTMGSNPS